MASRKDYECVVLEKDDEGIAWVTLNRPEKRMSTVTARSIPIVLRSTTSRR